MPTPAPSRTVIPYVNDGNFCPLSLLRRPSSLESALELWQTGRA